MNYLEEMFGLVGKTVVLTGGGGVLASQMAEALLNAGANVSLWGVHTDSIEIAVNRLRYAFDWWGKVRS